ncbi:MAG: energy transducer TonB [Bacteroidota bacterium]
MRKIYTTAVCLLVYLFLPAQPDPFAPDTSSIFVRADQMPYFPGCEGFENGSNEKRTCSNTELVRFLSRYLVYPDKAKYDGVEGTVFVSFIVDQHGQIHRPGVLMDIGGGCGQAALDVINEMPRWEPAVHQGKPVKVKMNLPIQFFLRAEGLDEAEPYSLFWGTLHGKQTTKKQLTENISNNLYVRGPEGSNRYVDQIEFVFQKDSRLVSASSRGDISSELVKVIDRVKKGGTFSIYASVQDDGQFITVSRSYNIVK